jgi:hypothetical protein
MRCPECRAEVREDVRGCICGWVKPAAARPASEAPAAETPRASPARAREAIKDIATYTSRHLRNTRTREQIIANWRWVLANACSRDAFNMARDALRQLGGDKDREPGQDDEEHGAAASQ